MRALDLGKRVALIERGRAGGAGVHAGALSSKTMWHLANDYATAKRTDRGYRAVGGIEVAYDDVCLCIETAVGERQALLDRQLAQLEAAGGLTIFRGSASFLTPTSVEVTRSNGDREEVSATNFLIATGSSPRVPDTIPVDGRIVVTSDAIETLGAFPESMLIVGAGVVGCEYATAFGKFGKTKIRILDRQPRILPFEDEDVADAVAKNFEAMGIRIHRSSKLESLRIVDDEVEYVITNAEGKPETIRVSRALVSVGRVPNTRTLGLAAIGVAIEKSGSLTVEATRTTVPNIWAAGDVTMDIALVNVAELEGRFAVERMFGLDPRPIRYEALSSIMFLEPEVASVGLNEQQAKLLKIPYRVGVVGNRLVNRAVAMRNTGGFVKLLASPDNKILGLRVVGPQASSTIQGIAFLIEMDANLDDIDRCVHPHPAIPEGVQECARMMLGRSIMKVDVFGSEGLLRVGEG